MIQGSALFIKSIVIMFVNVVFFNLDPEVDVKIVLLRRVQMPDPGLRQVIS